MNVSELIEELIDIRTKHGDIDVYINTNKSIESAKSLDDSMIFSGEAGDCLDIVLHRRDSKEMILYLGD